MLSRLEAGNLAERCKTVLREVAGHQGSWHDAPHGRGIDCLCDVYQALEPIPPVFWNGAGPETFTNLRLLLALAISPGLPPYHPDENPLPRHVWLILEAVHTLGATLGYPYLEHLCRAVSPWLDADGRYIGSQQIRVPPELGGSEQSRTYSAPPGTGQTRRVNNIAHALFILGQSAPIAALRTDLAELDGALGIYERTGRGRNALLHGSATHSFEYRFLALLGSLIYLRHVEEGATWWVASRGRTRSAASG